jgi:hypothetical protein
MRTNLSPSSTWWRFIVLLPAVCCMSCSRSEPLYPVQGKLLHNNQPVAGALLTFHPKDANINTIFPTGVTEEDGTFTVETGPNEGAPAGEYVVTVIAPHEVKSADKKTFSMGRKQESADSFKGAYAQESSSKLRIEIKKGNNELGPLNLN